MLSSMNLSQNLRVQAALFLVAVPLHLAWEVTQIMAYDFPQDGLVVNVIGCFIPTLGDGLMTLMIYWGGLLVFRDAGWVLRIRVNQYVFMALLGFALAVAIEWNALYRTRAWHYTARMPLVPIVAIGMLPVLQMLILPPVTALLVRHWWRWREKPERR